MTVGVSEFVAVTEHIGALRRVFGAVDRANVEIQGLAIVLGEAAAIIGRRAEHPHLFERADRAHRLELTTGLKSRSEQAQHLHIGAREILGGDAAGRADACPLHDAVVDDAEELPRIGGEQQHLAVIASARLGQRELYSARRAVHDRTRDNIRIQPDGGDARFGPGARHRLQIVNRAILSDRHDRILTGNIDRIAVAEVGKGRLDCLDAIWHLEQRFDIFIGQKDHRGHPV